MQWTYKVQFTILVSIWCTELSSECAATKIYKSVARAVFSWKLSAGECARIHWARIFISRKKNKIIIHSQAYSVWCCCCRCRCFGCCSTYIVYARLQTFVVIAIRGFLPNDIREKEWEREGKRQRKEVEEKQTENVVKFNYDLIDCCGMFRLFFGFIRFILCILFI